MFNAFYPREYVDSAYDIPYEEFYGRGIRGVIFDIDNTLVPHGAPADTRAVALFERLRGMGMETCLMSNNKEPRVTSFAAQVASRYLFKAGKPRIKGYKRAMELMKTDEATTLFVGDQLFTDVVGAHLIGMPAYLVAPLVDVDLKHTQLVRKVEGLFLKEPAPQSGICLQDDRANAVSSSHEGE